MRAFKKKLQLLNLNLLKLVKNILLVPQHIVTLRNTCVVEGSNFPAQGSSLPLIRQLPHHCSFILDDKRAILEGLASAGCQHFMPSTWVDGELFLSSIESTDRRFELHLSRNEENMSGELQTLHVGSISQPGTCQFHVLDPTPAGWFLKHRCGVKGQSVYFYASLGELQDRLKSLRTCSAQDFIVQQAVQPLLLRGRKFVLRAHVLLTAAP